MAGSDCRRRLRRGNQVGGHKTAVLAYWAACRWWSSRSLQMAYWPDCLAPRPGAEDQPSSIVLILLAKASNENGLAIISMPLLR